MGRMRSSCQQCPWFLPHGSKMSELERWITRWMHRQITNTNADPTTLSVRGPKRMGTFQFLDILRLIEGTADDRFSFSSIKPENCDVGKPSPVVPIFSSTGMLRWLVPNFRILYMMDVVKLQMISTTFLVYVHSTELDTTVCTSKGQTRTKSSSLAKPTCLERSSFWQERWRERL